jgi:hypothetical protein
LLLLLLLLLMLLLLLIRMNWRNCLKYGLGKRRVGRGERSGG